MNLSYNISGWSLVFHHCMPSPFTHFLVQVHIFSVSSFWSSSASIFKFVVLDLKGLRRVISMRSLCTGGLRFRPRPEADPPDKRFFWFSSTFQRNVTIIPLNSHDRLLQHPWPIYFVYIEWGNTSFQPGSNQEHPEYEKQSLLSFEASVSADIISGDFVNTLCGCVGNAFICVHATSCVYHRMSACCWFSQPV
jgi:hypothetical protein